MAVTSSSRAAPEPGCLTQWWRFQVTFPCRENCSCSVTVVAGMAEDQELPQAHTAPLEPALQQRSSSTYRSAEHSQALLSGLVSLRDSSILFDVVLVVEDKPIEAHRILLAASCDYFRNKALVPAH